MPQDMPQDTQTETLSHPDIVGVDWPIFMAWLNATWLAGKHIALIGPTGEGKTTVAVRILMLRQWVLALDPKGEDETLSASGYERITRLPLARKYRLQVERGIATRLIVGGSATNDDEERRLRDLMRQAIAMVRQQGGWTIYADEFQILGDLRMFGLGKPIEQLLIAARKNGTSVVTSFQALAWVPKAATRQAWGVILFPTRDRAMIKAVAESMGRDYRTLEEAVWALESFHALVIPRNVRAPMVLIKIPRLAGV